MRKKIFAVYDDVANEITGGLVMDNSNAPAIRAFHDALKMKDSQLATHPGDFRLIMLGEIDTTQGIIIPRFNDTNETIATGAAWLEAMEKGMIVNG
ncbi:MAG: nonstructural protein [Microvirus sp.]|nr:MAG: nonstructural protein [Microvirus sp.]